MSDSQVRRRLRQILKRALDTAGTSQVYLELFAGSSRLAAALRRVAQQPVLAIDSRLGEWCDLTRPAVQTVIGGWVKAGLVKGMWAGFPCTTWSVSRWPALRSNDHPWGLPECLAQPRLDKCIKLGNATLRATVKVLRACLKMRVPSILENPHSSRAWQTPSMQHLAALDACQTVVCDCCQWGSPWRKRTRLMCFFVPRANHMARMCTGKHGMCSRGKPHVHIRGPDPSGQLRSRLAEPCPKTFATSAAKVLWYAAEHRQLERLFSVATY